MEDKDKPEIPDVIVQYSTGDMYRKGQFLGQGFFAQCHVVTNIQTNQVCAAKIIAKSHSAYSKSVLKEVSLHSKLNHKHIIKMHEFFEDLHYGYILMEVCIRGNMQDMLKLRVVLTEPEVRYYMKQTLAGLSYLHRQLIIHRDLKLGNLLLTDDLQVKIGDFGTAIESSEGTVHHGICGTPNYIAPEVVTGAGHSFEFDIFSTGCILYTLLLGTPPFQDISRERVFERVQFCEYFLPTDKPSIEAKDLIQRMLQLNPSDRPTVQQTLSSKFMKGFVPARVPLSSLTEPPKFEEVRAPHKLKSKHNLRKPLQSVNTRPRNFPYTSVVFIQSDKETSEDRSCTPQDQLQSRQNIKNKEPELAIARKSQTNVKPRDDGNVELPNSSSNPFDVSEESQPITCSQCGDEPNILSRLCSCQSVECKDSQPQDGFNLHDSNLQSVDDPDSDNTSFSWLNAGDLERHTKLMNRIRGTPCSNVEKRVSKSVNHPNDMFACGKSLLLEETKGQKNGTVNLKRTLFNKSEENLKKVKI